MSGKRWMVCKTCGYPLEMRDGSGEQEWLHIRPVDHQPDPIDAADLDIEDLNQRCDFCDRDMATDLVLAESFLMPFTDSQSVGHWAACEQCAEMVRRRRWSQLVTHVKKMAPPPVRDVPRSILLAMYEAVGRHMYGFVSLQAWRASADYPLPVDDDVR